MASEERDDENEQQDTEPEDAFALIGNATRADILRVLGAAAYDELSFSELRSRSSDDIDSAQFNYHLQQLVGQFVEHTEAGYQIRPAGMDLYRAIRAGTFNRRATLAPFDAGFDCHYCSHPVEASYDRGMFKIACPDCDHVYSFTRAPPSAVEDATEEELLSRVDQYNRHQRFAMVRGVCPYCVNEVATEFVSSEEMWLDGADHLDLFAEFGCDYCGYHYYASIGGVALHDPTVIAFLETHGVDVATKPHWEYEFATTDRTLTVRSRNPWEFGLSVSLDEVTVEFVIDEQLTVVETNEVT